MSRSVRRVMAWLAGAATGLTGFAGNGEVPIAEVEPRSVRPVGTRVMLEVSASLREATDGRVVGARGTDPLGWFDPVEVGQTGRLFVSRGIPDALPETGTLRAWVIGPELVAATRPQWPVGAELWATIDAVGPGAASVWIDAGANQGIAAGDCWWRRVNGQPVARYDVCLVGREVCFCRVVPLAAGLRPARGEVVSLWPTPGQRRTGRAASAVSLVETEGEGQIVWVAAPPQVDAPAEPRLDFHRAGRYIGSGVVERRDRRFWHVRTLSAAGVGDIRVGDDAVIRTSADIRERRLSARVFEQTPAGYLINVGEIDGLSAGDTGTVYRAGRQIGRVLLTRIQRGYSVARPPDDGDSERFQRLDEVLFRPRPPPTATLGVVERVTDETLFSARLVNAAAPPLFTPLAVRRAGQVIGVAILLEVSDRRALGFALAPSLTRPPAVGDELTLSPEPGSRDTQLSPSGGVPSGGGRAREPAGW